MDDWNAPQQLKDQLLAEPVAPEIQPGNALIVRLFYAVATQWNYAGMAACRTGLNYHSVQIRASALPEWQHLTPELIAEIWDGIQIMEYAALAEWAEQQNV